MDDNETTKNNDETDDNVLDATGLFEGDPAKESASDDKETPDDDTAPTGEESTELVTVMMDGKAVQVTPDAAAAFNSYNEKVISAATRIADTPVPVTDDKVTEESKLTSLLFDDPDRFIKEVTNKISEGVQAATNQTNTQAMFWDKFYVENPELDRTQDHAMAQSLLQQNYNQMKDLPANTVITELGKLTKDNLISISKRFGGKGGGDKKTQLTSGGKRPAVATTESSDAADEKPRSLSTILKSRAEARRKAASN